MAEPSQQITNELPPNPLDILFRESPSDYNDKYVNKLRELARQHGQDLFANKNSDKVTALFNPQINIQSISPTPSTSSTSSTASNNFRHFKKALILQSNLEDKPSAEVSDVQEKEENDEEEEEETPLQIVTEPPTIEQSQPKESEDESDQLMDTSDPLNAASELSSISSEVPKFVEAPKNGKMDFSIKSLSTSKYSSDEEANNRSSVLSRTDNESVQSEDMKDDSLKDITSSSFDFTRPSTSGLSSTNSSSFSIPPMSSPLSSSTPVSSQQSFSTMLDMPTMVPTHVGRKPLNGPPCSLKTLVDDGILDPMDGALTYEIMGAKFLGDLLPSGFIRMNGTSQVFANPSSWANFCRSTIPSCSKDQKNFGSAWSIIRYLGKRLDSYKLRWYRKQKKQYMGNGSNGSTPSATPLSSTGSISGFGKKNNTNMDIFGNYMNSQMLQFQSANSLAGMANLAQFGASNLFNTRQQYAPAVNRDRLHKLDKISAGDEELNKDLVGDDETDLLNFQSIDLTHRDEILTDSSKVKTVSFSSVFCMQPFTVTMQSNAIMLIDFHAHLIKEEVTGYLGGIWEPRPQHLNITSAFPFQFTDPKEKRREILKIKHELQRKGQILVGWYHSHPESSPHPSVKDIKQQLAYQKDMLKSSSKKAPLLDYSPCVGLIVSPFYSKTPKLTALFQMFWVMPMYVQNCRDFGRPMQISYTLARDSFLTSDLLAVMRCLAHTYVNAAGSVDFKDDYQPDCTYYRKMKESLKPILPRDLIPYDHPSEMQDAAIDSFWNFIRALLLPPPKSTKPTPPTSED